jgi:hypothetical protein
MIYLTAEERLDAISTIAYLMCEYYTKEDILKMYPKYEAVYDELCQDALAQAMSMVRGSEIR